MPEQLRPELSSILLFFEHHQDCFRCIQLIVLKKEELSIPLK